MSIFKRCFGCGVRKPGTRLRVLLSEETDIYFNLAIENALLSSYGSNVAKDSAAEAPLLFLWRNSPCVIVGRNQNVWSECNLDNVKRDNVKLVRRFTGGGAVYQDLGNTCFTFISPSADYNFEKNSRLICAAMSKLTGKVCEPSGRNDLCVDGLKFSGAAFKVLPNAALHHGTLLININQGSLDKYLTPDKSKLEKHNVQSVKARVTNLSQYNPSINHDIVCDAIIEEVSAHYGSRTHEVERLTTASEYCRQNAFLECYNKLTDSQWTYGDRVLDYKSLKHRFDFGSLEFCFDLSDDIVANIWIFSDTLNADFITWLHEKLNHTPLRFLPDDFDKALGALEYEGCNDMIAAIREWLVAELRRAETSARTPAEDDTVIEAETGPNA
ncbi:lipoyltransferase and lipoate- ligase subfamily protein [Babesia ovata]|uniref:lipoate--protein ligase n=1 Tax=Babesia ovata TaxID=189622 RepID=A0A2H6KGY1_9APIC|nr:lipoyltransferase and lipoate- ligase subfamily protein [Babesia ovata]GBE62244.1 lipoyltransferase and lipoate- ligase subfamily protein [Babesia ovata]